MVQARDYTSTAVYQGYAEGYGAERVETITREALGDAYMQPDAQVILDFPDEREADRLARIAGRGLLDTPDTFEMRGQDFQQRLRDGYRIVASSKGIELIDAHGTRSEIAERVWGKTAGRLLKLVEYNWDEYPG